MNSEERIPTRKALAFRPSVRAFILCLGLLVCFATTARAGSVMRVAEDRLPRGINPLFTEYLVDLRVSALLFSGLFEVNRYNQTTPVLAEEATVSAADPRVVVITLKAGLTWHDMTPITAQDVLYTIDLLRNPKLESSLSGMVEPLAEASVLDERRLSLTYRFPVRDVERRLTFPILPAHAFGEEPVTPLHPFRLRPVGAGPYILEGFRADGTIRLGSNLNYALGRPAIPNIELREIKDKQIQIEALRFGNLEVVVRALPRDLPDLDRQRHIDLRPYQTNSWWYIGLNLRRPPFSDPRVRQALSELIDVDKLLEPIGGGERISGPFVPSSPYYNHHESVVRSTHDPEEAARLMAGAGYTRDEEGRFVLAGKPLELHLAVEKSAPVAREVAVNLQGQLKRAGIDVRFDWLDSTGWDKKVLRDKDFDMTLSQWSFDRSEIIFDQFHSKGRYNYVGYSSALVDQWLEQAGRTIDPEQRRELYQRVHARLAEDRPYIFLWTLTQYAAFSSRVQGVAIDPFVFYSHVHQWTMDSLPDRTEDAP